MVFFDPTYMIPVLLPAALLTGFAQWPLRKRPERGRRAVHARPDGIEGPFGQRVGAGSKAAARRGLDCRLTACSATADRRLRTVEEFPGVGFEAPEVCRRTIRLDDWGPRCAR